MKTLRDWTGVWGWVFMVALWAAPAHAATASMHTLAYDGETRGYALYVPPTLKPGQRVPLVLVLHGGGGRAADVERMTGFTQVAAAKGFIVAYPEGSGRIARMKTWNAGHCCGYAMRENMDDIGFIGALIDALGQGYPVDPRRVFVTGMSNGGMMTEAVGLALSGKVRAIAPVVAGLFGDERVPGGYKGMAVLLINGGKDETVPPAGGQTHGRFAQAWDGTPLMPTVYQGRFWAAANGCKPIPAVKDVGMIEDIRYTCPNQLFPVEQMIVKDNPHAWPGGEKGSAMGDEPSQSLNATKTIWQFFSQF